MSDTAVLSRKADFPGLVTADGEPWHYLDTAASAQKPQVVVDAMSRALGVDYATVHRGVYGRSAQMTLGYESARRRVAEFIGAKSENEVVFVRGATEAINLVAASWGMVNIGEGDRIVLAFGQIQPPAFFIGARAFAALLDHFVEDGDNPGIVGIDTLIHLYSLDF